MKEYAYFPGCSLEKMGLSYHLSATETTQRLGVQLHELEDWNCCGATAYFHVDEVLAFALSARNLAMAEKQNLDVVCPCSGCYKNMYSARTQLRADPDMAEHINYALEADNLHFSGKSSVRHLMEVLVEDVGLEEIKSKMTHPLTGLRIAVYYGCQMVRPKKGTEDVEQPRFFEDLMATTGGEPIDYPLRLRCCGGSLIISSRPAALSLVHDLLQNAVDRGAAVIATACPMCQINLECYQGQVNEVFGTKFSVPVLYFTQVLGLAMGVAPERLGIGSELVSAEPILAFCNRPQAV
ncbi:MAG: CoB--CoM heterodisulfide reductase iron-sulfur subunit B family protein [Anaerolineales bacterium]|jgi:heterodisulfide reductase subunit B